MFLTLEDETGLVNVILQPDLYARQKAVLVGKSVLEIEGVLQSKDGLSVRATHVRAPGSAAIPIPSRDFH